MPFKSQTDHQKRRPIASFFVSRIRLSPKGSFNRYTMKTSLRARITPVNILSYLECKIRLF